jgi:predicted DsbA family dithiol-disulfide isomerase
MLIEVFADFSCPWCYMGLRRLGRAQAQRPRLGAQIRWQPFQLNPELPAAGVNRETYLAGRTGDLERLHATERALEESGRGEGIRFAFDRIARLPNTLAAHRLMRFAARFGQDMPLADGLFAAYFEHGRDIGDPHTLAALAADVSLDAGAAREFLEGTEETDAVAAMNEIAHRGKISGVPYFIFDRRYALAGAQEPASFLPLFDAIAQSSDENFASAG